MIVDVDKILLAIKDDVVAAAKVVMIQHGVPQQSDLIKSVDMELVNSNLVLVANNYYVWLSAGRKAGIKKVPIQALISWIKKYRIVGRSKKGRFISQVSLAFAIQNSIYKKGIRGRNYADKVEEITLDILSEQLTEIMSIAIADVVAESISN